MLKHYCINVDVSVTVLMHSWNFMFKAGVSYRQDRIVWMVL